LEKLLRKRSSSHEEVFRTYKEITSPGVARLAIQTIRNLLHHMAIVQRKDEHSMHRYMAIVNDMNTAGIDLTRSEWAAAVHFVGRGSHRGTDIDVADALHLWREMEQDAGIVSTHAHFNILFDIATKAGKYALAEMILQEINRRQLPVNRYLRLSYLYYQGLRRDGNAVRAAYKDLVDVGHVVNTAALNTLISALILAHEPHAAELVFARMKRLHASKTLSHPPRVSWRDARSLSKLLAAAFKHTAKDSELRGRMQEIVSIAPDAITFKLLVKHHATTSGDIDRVAALLDEMQAAHFPLDVSIFHHLFRGFGLHGGIRYSAWTRFRLENTWDAYLAAVEHHVKGFDEFKLSIVVLVLGAYKKCAKSERVVEVWREMRKRWEPGKEEVEAVYARVGRTVARWLDDG
ncbi:hypothetical protein M501DRAFT_930340, partial [Patellaria atrata CBS 101060]